MIKSTRIKALNRALYVIECPQCGRWLASASESSMLPEFAFCDCDSEQHTCGQCKYYHDDCRIGWGENERTHDKACRHFRDNEILTQKKED